MTATYPVGIKTFTAPVDGVDDVLATFVIQPQEEIAAIETALGANLINVVTRPGTGKITPVDADGIPIIDSTAGDAIKKLTWANLKATLKTYLDTLYLAFVSPGISGNVLTSNGTNWTSAAPTGGGGSSDGWNADTNTWTYLSASSFKVPGDKMAIFTKGTRLRFTQSGTVKYATVVSSSYSSPDTTVTIIVNTDYTIANAAITANSYSYINSPDWPGWFNYTTTFTGFSADPGLGASRYKTEGNICFVNHYTNSAGTSNATNFKFTLPVDAAGVSANALASTYDNGAMAATGLAFTAAASNQLTLFKSAAATWTATGGKYARIALFYEW